MSRDDSRDIAADARGCIRTTSSAIGRLLSDHRKEETAKIEKALIALQTASNYLNDYIDIREARNQ